VAVVLGSIPVLLKLTREFFGASGAPRA